MNIIEQIKTWFKGKPIPPTINLGGHGWEFGQVWNQSLVSRPERPPMARNTVWASEIGGSMIDRYLKMNGIAQSNPPNARSLRKFQAADIFEWVVGFVLQRAGLLIDSQEKLRFQYPGLLEVVGKLDHLAGGQPDWGKARKQVLAIGLPPLIENASIAIIKQLSERFGDEPLKTIVIEVKSLGTFVFDRYESTKKADPRHIAQQFHYLKAKPLPEGHIAYICRDDCRIVEIPVFNPSAEAERYYRTDIEKISGYIQNNERPPLEKELLFDDLKFQFRHNWAIEYSGYLTMLYGYQEPIFYRDKWKKAVSDFNRVFKRCVTEAKMTDKNKAVIERALSEFPAWWDKVAEAKIAAQKDPSIITETEEETE